MTAQIINLADYRKAKEAEQVRKVVNDYFAAHSQIMAWWLPGTPAGSLPAPPWLAFMAAHGHAPPRVRPGVARITSRTAW